MNDPKLQAIAAEALPVVLGVQALLNERLAPLREMLRAIGPCPLRKVMPPRRSPLFDLERFSHIK